MTSVKGPSDRNLKATFDPETSLLSHRPGLRVTFRVTPGLL